jgi:hypothetical protein
MLRFIKWEFLNEKKSNNVSCGKHDYRRVYEKHLNFKNEKSYKASPFLKKTSSKKKSIVDPVRCF